MSEYLGREGAPNDTIIGLHRFSPPTFVVAVGDHLFSTLLFTIEDTAQDVVGKYQEHKDQFVKFLLSHEIRVRRRAGDDDSDGEEMPHANDDTTPIRRVNCYRRHLQDVKDRCVQLVPVPLAEVAEFDAGLANAAAKNTLRYHSIFCEALDQVLRDNFSQGENATPQDALDLLLQEQAQQAQQQQAQQQANGANNNNNPYDGGNLVQEEQEQGNGQGNNGTPELLPELLRRYELVILPGHGRNLAPFRHQVEEEFINEEYEIPEPITLRQVRATHMGQLVTVTGLVVRASDVQPRVAVATYRCTQCDRPAYKKTLQQREFLPPVGCDLCKLADTMIPDTRGSRFAKFQELRLQELPNHVPVGHVPRSVLVHTYGEWTRVASPGNTVTIDAVVLPQRVAESGYAAMQQGLIATTFLQAQHIFVHRKTDETTEGETDWELEAKIHAIASGEDPVGRLARAVAPEIYGHEDIKRALILQLVAGCTRKLPDGVRLRGDLNILLLGDPGVAKSQLLKHTSMIAPRAMYTTGKGSSGVGLTAAITKDTTTGELSLEGGALVLADFGVCCIDEFDKMDEADRTAIHEVMEQQTVSIAKAGIVARLNARTAVLAAANPLYGRYHLSKSLTENINLPNSLLSRFDLVFLILDQPDVERDTALARHVTLVHQGEKAPVAADTEMDPHVLRAYIARARQHQPVVPPEVAPYVVEAYVSLRQSSGETHRGSKQQDQTVMTARQLLSILRLSQALARVRFSDFLAREDVDEAIRLMNSSKASLTNNEKQGQRPEDVMSRVFRVLRDAALGKSDVELKTAQAMVLRKGFTVQQFDQCIEEYETLQVIQVNQAKTHIYFIDGGS